MYILAKGCEDVGIEPPEDFRTDACLDILEKVVKIFENVSQKTLLCVNFMLNESYDKNETENIISLDKDFNRIKNFIKLKPQPDLKNIFVIQDNSDENL